ncbi:MAG: NF038122 family metalloprotease [Nostocaceae cyanobacterium]|nr:NF038122 family metalloprotease [Nostocaceae cyanobacterium]
MKTKRFQVQKWYLRTVLAITGVVASSTSALAVTFNFSYDPGTTTQQKEAMELAGQIWSSYLLESDTIDLNIHVAMKNLGNPETGGPLGAATPAIFLNHQTSNQKFLQQDGSITTENTIMLTTSNYKALSNSNIPSILNNYGGLDGYIQMNTNAPWHYDYTTDVSSNEYDFVTVALHEIGHTLGFISGVGISFVDENGNTTSRASWLDLFRYSDESKSLGARDFRVGSNAYFSLFQSQFFPNLGNFSTGDVSNGGDGFQPAHWKHDSTNPLGIMTPVLEKGQRISISNLDLTAMGAINWDVNFLAQLDINALLQEAQTQASNAVMQDRTSDVQEMIAESVIYNQDGWCDPIVDPNCGWWQSGDGEEVTSVPEPSAIMGLLGLLGIGAFFKVRSKKDFLY